MFRAEVRTHEIGFCSRVAKWSEEIFARRADLPLKRVEISESPAKGRPRSDVRVYDRQGVCVLTGEVKMPDTRGGCVADSFNFVSGAYDRAAAAGVRFFFTWNVNTFVLFDLTRWRRGADKRRVADYDLRLGLSRRQDLDRPEVEARIREFLETFYAGFAARFAGLNARPTASPIRG